MFITSIATELDSLLNLQVDGDGARSHPLNRNKFYARDIQTGRAAYCAIQENIAAIKAERQAAPRP